MNINEPLSSIKNASKHYLRDISNDKNKKKWVKILTNEPNLALEEYHSILCKNNPENEGYCNLLDLFKILGALEQMKNNDNDSNTRYNEDLVKIDKAVTTLKKNIENQSPGFQNNNIENNNAGTQTGDPNSAAANNTKLVELQKTIETMKQYEENYKTEYANALDIAKKEKENLQKELKTIENSSKNAVDGNEILRNEIKERNVVKTELMEKIKKIEELNGKMEKDSAGTVEQLKQLTKEHQRVKEELEKVTAKGDKLNVKQLDKMKNLESGIQKMQIKMDTQTEVLEQAKDNKYIPLEGIEWRDCTDEGFSTEISQKFFKLYEEAKDIINSYMLPLIGCVHFNKIGLFKTDSDIHNKILQELESALFIELNENQYNILKSTIQTMSDGEILSVFNTIIERDSKYNQSGEKNVNTIMVYSLLWIFHFDIDTIVNQDEPIYQQLLSNKSIVLNTGFINNKTCGVIRDISAKINGSIKVLGALKTKLDAKKTEVDAITLKYNRIVQQNKSVLTILKRRDDWIGGNIIKPHKRFKIKSHGIDTISKPLKLLYNDTPLEIVDENFQTIPDNMTHTYSFYGFDKVFDPIINNKIIASNLSKSLSITSRNSSLPQPLCFIGYGQSGSGKTSALISFQKKDSTEDGILLELLKKMKPKKVEISIIEIYSSNAASKADKSCIAIEVPQTQNGGGGKVVDCMKKERVTIDSSTIETTNPTMRYITLDEVLNKHFDENNKKRIATSVTSNNTVTVTFEEGKYPDPKNCPGGDTGAGWFYNHETAGDQDETCFDKIGLKHYILNAFKCREIAPTSNNKESSRSHVVVSMKLYGEEQNNPGQIFVCDLAGVENDFDCNLGSTDITRMKAKTKTNVDYSNIYKGVTENWSNLNGKRDGNKVKYVHKDIHIGKTNDEPICWPDGEPNDAGDINTIKEKYSRYLLSILFYHLMNKPTNTKTKFISDDDSKTFDKFIPVEYEKILMERANKDISSSSIRLDKQLLTLNQNVTGNHKITQNKNAKYSDFKDLIITYLNSVLSNEPLKKGEKDEIFGIDKVKKKIQKILNDADDVVTTESVGGDLLMTKKNSGSKSYNRPPNPIERKNIHIVKYETIDITDKKENNESLLNRALKTDHIVIVKRLIGRVRDVFSDLQSPDCATSFSSGFKKACEIRSIEGEIINTTLAQLTKDVKRISKYAIKEKFKETSTGNDYPCLFADIYDDYSSYSKSTNPLMGWYDIDKPLEGEFGSIITAMCTLSDKDTKSPEEKLNFLKDFKFNYLTVLNETYIMNNDGKEAQTPAGDKIYVNNPPLPPFINVGILENKYNEFIFYENDTRVNGEKKKELLKSIWCEYFNLIIKMLKHPIYQEMTVDRLSGIKDYLKNLMNDNDEINSYRRDGTNEQALKELKDIIVDIISIVKKNNNATFIGTIQTTEEVNRVSEKIILSKREKRDKNISLIEYDASGNGTINKGNLTLLKELISICTEKYNNANANDNYSLMSAKLYKCLYKIDETYTTSKIPKDYKTMKERDIDNMLKAIDTVLPIMKPYLNPQLLDNIWKEVSTIERGKFVGEGEIKYPLPNDEVNDNISIEGENSLYNILKKMLKKIKSNDKRPLLQFNTMLVNELKKEPSYNYLTQHVFNTEKKTQSFKFNYNTTRNVKVVSPKGSLIKGSLIKELTGNKQLSSPFYDKIYAAFVYTAYNKIEKNWNNIKNIEPGQVIKFLLSNPGTFNNIPRTYPPRSKRQRGGGGNASITVNSNSIIEKINGINYISPPPIGNNENVETSKEDLVKINEAVKRLRENIENMPSYAGNLEKLKEALQSLGATN
jgi:hypothetical protein